MGEIARAFGAKHILYGLAGPLQPEIADASRRPFVTNLPNDFFEYYVEHGIGTDPIVQRLVGTRMVLDASIVSDDPDYRRIWCEKAEASGVPEPSVGLGLPGMSGLTSIFVLVGGAIPKRGADARSMIRRLHCQASDLNHEIRCALGGCTEEKAVLTARERACLDLAALGNSVQKISAQLDISTRTVESHLKQCRVKLGARSTTHTVALAVYQGIVQPV